MSPWLRAARGVLLSTALTAATAGSCTPAASGPLVQPVVSGTPAAESRFPYFADIDPGPGGTPPLCDGSVIGQAWIITAAHCIPPGGAVLVGTTASIPAGGMGTPDPQWDGNAEDGNDLALVHVDPKLTKGIVPIPLGSPWDPTPFAPGTLAVIMGTGLQENNVASGQFRVANTRIRSDAEMAELYQHTFDWRADRMIGAGSPDATVCQGDSGSPLVAVPAVDRRVQVGVASFGATACDRAAVFDELSGAQLAWVASVVPEVKSGWTQCQDAFGRPGRSIATYGADPVNGPHRDGPNFWNIHCQAADAGMLRVRHSGLCANFAPVPHALVQGGCTDQQYNLFVLSGHADGYYSIVLATNDTCLGVGGASQDLRAPVRQYPCNEADPSQEWSLVRTDGGYFQVIVRHSGQCLDVQGDEVTPGALIWQYTCDRGENQQFRFVELPQCPAETLTGPSPLNPLPTRCSARLVPGS
jgi:Trypsin/Ricin-type beta-trefoil lectin domain-like